MREESEEAVEIHEVGSSHKGLAVNLITVQFNIAHHGLASLHHLAHAFGQLVKYLVEGHDKGVFVAITEHIVRHDALHQTVAFHLGDILLNVRMLKIERRQPVADVVEEGKTFHLRETAEVDVRTLLLHVHHALESSLQFLHSLVFSLWVKDILQWVLFLFDQAQMTQLQVVALDNVGHDFRIDGTRIALGVQTVYQLHLQLR